MESKIVVSGISGRFPGSDNIAEFSQSLFNKVDLTNDSTRWEPGLYGLPKKMGQLKDISKFDNRFFGVSDKQANVLDPQIRILLELAHEAIVDAGFDPGELRGKKIGVYVGNSCSETDELFCRDLKKISGVGMISILKAELANHISYTFDFKGPSFVMDTGCSSSASALYEAVQAIKNNECEAAIVGAAHLCLRPATTLQIYGIHALSDDGICKCFDAAADGYVRSEGIVAVLLQKTDVARRNYASIVHIKTSSDGFKEQGPLFPSAAMLKKLMKEVYEDCKLSPLKLCYFEAHGTGTPVGDPEELSAISEVFCPGREKPLLVGSVKSNMGHAEPASGLCSLVKLIISLENNLIPPNLHFHNPNPNIPALVDGKVRVVTNPTPLEGDYVAMNSFGIGGVSVHTLLKSNTTERKRNETEDMNIPQLVLFSGRTEEGVHHLFDYLQTETPPREFFALLHKSVYSSAMGKPYRGYKLLVKDQEVSEIKKLKGEKRPIWYIFSGMGTQWPGMAKSLMNLKVFARSIRRSAEVLRPYGLDLIHLLTNEEKIESNSRSIVPAYVCICAVQIALVDVLNEIGIIPDGVVGHSLGELGCAYADGSLTAEQMMLSSYWRGRALEDSDLETGAMAAIGMTWSQANKCCPKDIFPSCHNAEDTVTISGPKKSIEEFVDSLKAENVFAREVDSCGYAFHSQYVFPAVGKSQTALEKVIPNPKPRTSRWISSSYPKQKWDDESAKFASASYFVNNFVSPVLFHEALQHVPKNAVVVEIAPHHLLQAILKRAIGPDAEYIGLMKRNVDNTVHLLSSLGRLYTAGLNPDTEKLYPQVHFPVPKGTPMISPLIKWDHSESWWVAKWEENSNYSQMITEVNVGSDESPDEYLLDHSLHGRCLYPTSGYLVLVWKALAEIKGKDVASLPVTFEDVKIHKTTVLSKEESTKFLVEITTGGKFELSEGGTAVCTGHVHSQEGVEHEASKLLNSDGLKTLSLNENDIYKELRLRGYEYGPTFQGLAAADIEGNKGILKWTGEWVVFLDTMIQFTVLGSRRRASYLPSGIQSLKIDPVVHKSIMESALKEYDGIPVFHDKNTKRIISGGVELKNLNSILAPKYQNTQTHVLEEYRFVPYNETKILSKTEEERLERYIQVCSSLSKMILEKSKKHKDKAFEIINGFKEADDALIASYLSSYTDDHVLLKSLHGIMTTATCKDLAQNCENYINSYLSERDNDLLYQTMMRENPLRTVMDVVFENASSRKLKMVEISDSSLPLSSKICEIFHTLGVLNINCIIAHSKPNILDKSNLPSGNFELSSWDPKSPLTFTDVDLCVMKYLNLSSKENRRVLENVLPTLKDNGFILLIQRTHLIPGETCLSNLGENPLPIYRESDLNQTFEDLNLQVICKKSDSLTSTMYLLRKSTDISYEDIVIPVVENEYEKWVSELSKQMAIVSMSTESKRIWLVSDASNNTGIIGLVNCLRKEPGGSSIRCVFTNKEISKLPEFNLKNKFYEDIVRKNLTFNVFKRDTWGSFRHLTLSEESLKVNTHYAYLDVLNQGDLSSLMWVDSQLKFVKQAADSIICQVYYAPLNFKDVMLANGELPLDTLPGDLAFQDCILGSEFSGRMQDGQRVMGFAPAKCLATTVAVNANFLWKVPDDWSLEEAATVPVAYSNAYYALIMKGNLRKGERVLIHSGSGGVGQAAIAIALSLECEVFTTVDSSEKREFLKNRFSKLQDRNFCSFGDTSFEDYILNATNGEGVDVILNSLPDEKLKASLNCLAEFGRFLEIGKRDMSNNNLLGLDLFSKEISFFSIKLDALYEDKSHRSSQAKKEIVQLVQEGIVNGTVKPLNSTLFERDQAEQAFQFMGSGKHIGKVVLKIKDEEPQRKIAPTPVNMIALSRTICNPEKSYVIIGGLGGFGLELCQWLVDRGARHVVLTSRSGVKTGYQKLRMSRWKQNNINVIVSQLNAAKKNEAKDLLKMAAGVRPVAAIFNLALVIRDAFMENQTVEMYKEVCETKVDSTSNLDAASREICPALEWFVCFSSVVCGRGNAGQTNYGYANSVMERICEERSKQGLPGLAIQWGAIGDVGATQDILGSEAVIAGSVPQRFNSCLPILDKFLQQKRPVVSCFVPFYPSETTNQKNSKHNFLTIVGKLFGIKDMSSVNPETSLGELGMDSLIAVEMTQLLERDFDLEFSMPEVRHLKVKDLNKLQESSEDTETATTPESKN